jgi:integrase
MITVPAETFPPSFYEDLDGLIELLRNPDPLDPSGLRTPLRPATIAQYRRRLLMFASELVHSGIQPDLIERVDVLVDPTMAERGLRQMLRRNGNRSRPGIADIAALLRSIGERLNFAEATRKQIDRLVDRVAVPQPRGMTAKNRDRLRPLQDTNNLRRLLLLPERILERPQGKAKPFAMALAREDAVAIAILLYCPIRVQNLASINLERNLRRPGDGGLFLVFEPEEVKNLRHLEFELPRDVCGMIDRHLKTRSPLLCPPATPWLFPRRDGAGPVDASQLSSRLTRRIRRETGLEMNAHLFRHLAVMIWLNANPGSYEAARRLLGHSSISNTLNLYSGLEVRAATQAFAQLISQKKGRVR